MLGLFCCALLSSAAAQTGGELDLRDLLAATRDYVETYQAKFRQYVAQEVETQTEYRKGGERKRRTIADYYVVTLPSRPDVTVDFRDVLEVDGRPVRRDPEKLRALLSNPDRNSEQELFRLKHASNRYNLAGRGFMTNVAAVLLQYVGAAGQRLSDYSIAGKEGSRYLLSVRERGPATLFWEGDEGRRRPLPATGVFHVAENGCVYRGQVTLPLASEGLVLVYTGEYDPATGEIWLPSRRHLELRRDGRLVYECDARYRNYRRFTTDVKITTEMDR